MKLEKSKISRPIFIISLFVLLVLLLILQSYFEMKKGVFLYPINIVVFLIMNINLIVIVVLLILIARTFIKAYIARRRGLAGASFRFKVIASLIIVSIVPAFFLLAISVGFIHKSLSNWFSSRLNLLTESSVSLSKALIEEKKRSMAIISEKLLASNYRNIGNLEEFMRKYELVAIIVYDSKGGAIKVESRSDYMDEVDVKNSVREVMITKETSSFYVGRYFFYFKPIGDGVLVFVDRLPKDIAKGLGYVESVYREFVQLSRMKVYVERSYVYTFVFVMLMVVFASVWFGLQLAKSVVEPIELLIDATREVSKGNFSVRIDISGEDELVLLAKSFNEMVSQLGEKTRLLEDRKRFIETIVESVNSGIIAIDRDGRITLVNKALIELLGLEFMVEDLVGKRYYEIFDRDRFKEIYEVVVSSLREGSSLDWKRPLTSSVEFEVRGEIRNFLIKVSGMRSDSGELSGFIVIVDDVTDVVRAQRAFVWEEVARRLAHEIKNPLTPIKLSAQRLLKKYLDRIDDRDSFSRIVDTIIKSVDSMKKMVDEFYRFARMPEVKFEMTNIVDIMRELVELYRITNKDVYIELRVGKDFPERVMADGEQLRRAFMNLLDNAVHAMNGSGRIDIDMEYDRERNMLIIRIADTGVGIPDEDKERIFKPYYSTKDGGMGLGLTITDRIIADHGGYIRVEDNYPKGAIFIIEIPVRGYRS